VGRAHLTTAGDKAFAVLFFSSGVPLVVLSSTYRRVFRTSAGGRGCAVHDRRSSGSLN